MKKIILASGSPRRRELLEKVGLKFEVMPDNTPEQADMSQLPNDVVAELAKFKGENIRKNLTADTDALIISADTVVAINGAILGKPHSESDAFEMLSMLSGNAHNVYTGVYICDVQSGKYKNFYEKTEVFFKTLDTEEIKAYIRTGEPMDKAGAYGIQEYGAAFVKGICGDYFNVVGLPICRLCDVLKKEFETDIFA